MKASHIVIIFAVTIVVTSESEHSYPMMSAESVQWPVAEARGAEGYSPCHLPSRWSGSFFQSGVHQTITINRNAISTKGKCLEADGEKYLVFNEKDNCYRCVVFHEKHLNVLQYKETFCVPDRRSIPSLCSTITGDANLFSMFRLDAAPIDCPFRPPLSFTYNRGHGQCRYPVSTIESCIHSSRLLLNYQACPDIPGTESTSEELQCLAMWKEGSFRYLLGLIQYQHHSSYEERFRCFVYEKLKKSSSANSNSGHFNNSDGNVMFRVAQSGDATCNGLTPSEGSRTYTFRRAATMKPCQFPSWLQLHAQWHSLDQRSTFIFNTSSLRVSNSTDIAGIGPSTLTMTAVCSQILENPTLDNVKLVLHTTSECRSGFVCMTVYRRDGHIVELQMGSPSRRSDDACYASHFNQSLLPYVTLVSATPASRRCPNLGRFSVTGFTQTETKRNDKKCTPKFNSLSVGCNTLDTLQFRSDNECTNTEPTAEYSCHGTWSEQGVNYLITTPLSRMSTGARRYCFIFRQLPTAFQSNRYVQRVNNNKDSNDYTGAEEEDFSLVTEGSDDSISDFGRMLQFSSISDSCRRNVVPGIEGSLAFNVTSHGRCDDISSSTSLHGCSSLIIISFMVTVTCARISLHSDRYTVT